MRNLMNILITLAALALGLSTFIGTAHALDRCEIPNGATYNIDEHSTCRAVTNNHGSGQTIMVPTKTAAEWNTGTNAFLNALPAGVTAATCSTCGTITNCAAASGGGGVTPGSQTFSTAGSFNFVVPCHNNLIVQVWGAGAGGKGPGSCSTFPVGTSGGQSRWDGAVIGNGGSNSGSGGTASGGTTNTTGGAGGPSGVGGSINNKGGNGANGGAGGPLQNGESVGNNGSAPGVAVAGVQTVTGDAERLKAAAVVGVVTQHAPTQLALMQPVKVCRS